LIADLDAAGAAPVFSIASGNESGGLAIDSATGEISVSDLRALMAAGPDLNLTVAATSGDVEEQADIALSLPEFSNTITSNSFFRFGSGQDDLFLSGNSTNFIFSGSGNDLIFAGGGSDRVYAGKGDDIAYGESGNDLLSMSSGNDSLYGEDGNDRLYGSSGSNLLDGGASRDIIVGGNGNDTILGGEGNDWLIAGSGDDSVFGGEGSDRLYGSNGANVLDGGTGNDTIIGGSGDETISGGDGNDQMFGNGGADIFVLEDGFGNDRINYFRADADMIDLSAVTEIVDYDDLIANHITQSGEDNTLITVGDNTVLVDDLSIDQLDASLFIL